MDETLVNIMILIWKNGMCEQDFCASIGINKSAVTDWKKGKTKSYLKHLDKIAELFHITREQLIDSHYRTSTEVSNIAEVFAELFHYIPENLKKDIKNTDL